MRLKTVARRALRGFFKHRPAASELPEFQDLHPVKAVRGGSALNKAGRLVLSADSPRGRVKIYEAANADHATFLRAATGAAELSDLFPAILELRGRAVVAEWVTEGSTKPSVEDLAALQMRLHEARIDALPSCAFDYWNDYIWPRFSRASEMLGITDVASEVYERVTPVWNASRTLSHPDITVANVIGTTHRTWCVIDNELFSIGGLRLLDVCNTAYSLGSQADAYARAYSARSGMTLAENEQRVLNAAWLARRAGSSFVKGDLNAAMRLARRYRTQSILPFAV